MELRKFFAFITFAIIAIILMQTKSVTSCMCMPTHPQTQYCNSDYGKCEIVVRLQCCKIRHNEIK